MSLQDCMKRSDAPKRFVNAKLSDFPGMDHLKDANQDGLFIHGPTGTGKTHLAVAVFSHWARAGWADGSVEHQSRFISAPELLLRIRATYNKTGEESEGWVIRTFSLMPVLLLDDVGAEKITDWSSSSLYSIISARYNAMRPIIVTSNLTLAQISEWEPRIASRLGGMMNVELKGKDRRL